MVEVIARRVETQQRGFKRRAADNYANQRRANQKFGHQKRANQWKPAPEPTKRGVLSYGLYGESVMAVDLHDMGLTEAVKDIKARLREIKSKLFIS